MEKSSMKFLVIMLVVVIVGVAIAQGINAYTNWTGMITPMAVKQ